MPLHRVELSIRPISRCWHLGDVQGRGWAADTTGYGYEFLEALGQADPHHCDTTADSRNLLTRNANCDRAVIRHVQNLEEH